MFTNYPVAFTSTVCPAIVDEQPLTGRMSLLKGDYVRISPTRRPAAWLPLIIGWRTSTAQRNTHLSITIEGKELC